MHFSTFDPAAGLARFLRQGLRACAVAATLTCAQAQAPGDLRLALVIGNAGYSGPAALANPVNDARAMADVLRRLGFEVVEVRDGSQQQILEAVRKVGEQLQGKAGIGMLYYAGHGVQVDWRNFMVPVDAKLNSAADVARAAVDVSQVIDVFKNAGTRMNILVLDACRDNPFAQTAGAKGLAPLDAPPGTFLAYATAPGNVALDGEEGSGNSLYTGALVSELNKPVARIEDVFKRVRLQVRQKTQGRQVPWESTSLEDDFFFNSGKLAPAAKPDERERDRIYAQQKGDWEAIQDKATADVLYAFLQKHPHGSFSEFAQARLEALQKAQVRTQPGQDGKQQVPFDQRYQEGDRYEMVVKDGLTGVERNRGAVQVRFKTGDTFELQPVAGRMPTTLANRAGFVFQDVHGSYDPPWSVVPGGEYQVGKKAGGRSVVVRGNGTREWLDYESRIVAREKIDTAFGAVDTYKVEVLTLSQSGQRGKQTFWFDPDWGVALRVDTEMRRVGGSELRRMAGPDLRRREVVARSRVSAGR